MKTRQDHNHLNSTINIDYNEAGISQRIAEATFELNKHYVTMVAERMSSNNTDILSRFIIYSKKERNNSRNTVMSFIDGIVYLENYHQHKDLEKMDKTISLHFLIVTANQKPRIYFIDGSIHITFDIKLSLNFLDGCII
ncbi:MAG: hypothetical protein WBL68_01440 [Nitrososphaeraceae archaeon]